MVKHCEGYAVAGKRRCKREGKYVDGKYWCHQHIKDKISYTLFIEPTETPTPAPTESPTKSPTESPKHSPTPTPSTESPTEPAKKSPKQSDNVHPKEEDITRAASVVEEMEDEPMQPTLYKKETVKELITIIESDLTRIQSNLAKLKLEVEGGI